MGMPDQTGNTRSRMQLNHYLLLVYPLQYILFTILISTNIALKTTRLISLIDTLTLGIPTVTVVLFVLWKKYKSYNDYRFKSGVYFVIALLSVTLTTMLIMEEEIIDGSISSNKIPALLVILVPTILVIFGAIASVNQLVSPFENEIVILSSSVKSSNFDHQITNKNILNDSIFGSIAGFINSILTTSKNLISEMSSTSNLVLTTAETLSSSSEEVYNSAEEVSDTSQSMSSGATQQAEMIGSIVDQMNAADNVIQEIIKQIQNNTESVSQIALQTNILALNAGIEASRAGDYGRGFMVVAENVRKLSDQSKNSADQISNVINTISTTLQELFNEMQIGIMNVAAVSEETASSAEEVAAAAEEMTSAMEGINSLSQVLTNQAVQATNVSTN